MSWTRTTYCTVWRGFRRYFRYEVSGFENLPRDQACLIVGYHGRPVAWDLCILQVEVCDRLGYLPHGVVHGGIETIPSLAKMASDLGLVTGDGTAIRAAVDQGEHIMVVPGGTREGCRSFRNRYRVDWGRRVGYLKLALKYGLSIVPVAAVGIDDAYVGLNDGYRWGKRIRMPARLPFWLGVGPLGLWPWSMPFPVKIRQAIGAPIPIDGASTDGTYLARANERVQSAVQNLLDGLRDEKETGR